MVAMPFSGPFWIRRTDRGGNQTSGSKTSFNRDRKNLWRTEQDSGRGAAGYVCGNATALLSMLRMCGKGSIKRALVSGDACPKTVMKAIEEILQTRLWPHYGSREMGLGGAICCTAHEGMHMRENHCITEIIDENGNVLPDGKWGRTGDYNHWNGSTAVD